jgi:protein-S-isoprenylcysteine O-methyltransferase Ste14
MNSPNRRLTSYFVIGLASVLGGGTLMLFMLFLYIGPLKLVNLGLDGTAALWLNTCLCLAFFVQHSVMIRKSFRQRLAQFIPEKYDGAFFAIVAGVFLLVLIVFWQESAYTIASAQGILLWLLRGVFLLSIAGFAWSWWALGVFDPFGILPILDHLRGRERPPILFTARGPYCWVRHPLYILMLLMIWSYPNLTADRMLFNVLCTIWMIIGTVLEERDLVVFFGKTYRDYQNKVPMLIPYRLPQNHSDDTTEMQ